jgi:hypothetical protein
MKMEYMPLPGNEGKMDAGLPKGESDFEVHWSSPGPTA